MKNIRNKLSNLIIVVFFCFVVGMVAATPSIASTFFDLGQLTDVNVTGVTNGQVIKFNSSSSEWEPANDKLGVGGGGYDQGLNTTDSPTFNDITITLYPNLDKDSTDDFSGDYDDLTNKPTNFSDDDLSDNDTDDLSEGSSNFWCTLLRIQTLLSNDYHNIGGTDITDTNWNNLTNVPSGFSDNVDNTSSYNQDLNTTDSPTFDDISLTSYPNLDKDSTDDFSGSYTDLTNKPTNFSDDDLSDNDTDDLPEGSSNFYATLSRIRSLLFGQWLSLSNSTFTDNITIGTKTITDSNITYWDTHTHPFNYSGYDQDLNATNAVTFDTIDTGEGANELFDMDQNVLTSSEVEFENLTVDNTFDMSNGGVTWNMYVNATGVLVWEIE